MLTPTLADLLTDAGITPLIYHLGRRVEPCMPDHFRAFEYQQVAWSHPWQSQARVALVLTPAPEREPIIWCLALPLDEQSMLVPAQRDGFLEQLAGTLQRAPDGHLSLDVAAEKLKNVAIALQPEQLTLALLHARIAHDMALAPSQHYAFARAYYLNAPKSGNWEQLGLQGIADLAVRRSNEDEATLAQHIPALSAQALKALCDCLVHVPVRTPALLKALIARHDMAAAHDNVLAQACMGAVLASDQDHAGFWMDSLLEQSPDAQTMAIMAVRGWHHLEHERRPGSYLASSSHLAEHDFRILVRDLTRIPRLRLPMIMAMKQAPAGSPLSRQIEAIQRERHE